MLRFGKARGVLRAACLGTVSLALWGCCSARPQNHLILLDSAGKVVKEEKKTVLSKAAGNEIAWKAPDGQAVAVVFEVPCNQPKPFRDMSCQNNKWRIDCPAGCQVCPSGPINPALEPPNAGLHFGYIPSVIPAQGPDPKIIIKP